MKNLTMIIVILFAFSTANAQKKSKFQNNNNGSSNTSTYSKLGGTYSVDGTNPDGSNYQGTCIVKSTGTDSYSFNWTVAGKGFSGNGKLSGDLMVVDFGDTYPVKYSVNEDGAVLRGTWSNGEASEVLRK